MAITQDQIIGLTKEVFILDYILNGLFPCESDIVRLIRSKQREWTYSDKFEYRMRLSMTNTGGSLNSQVFKENVGLVKPGKMGYGIYNASYGSVMDGIAVDMMANLETNSRQAAFNKAYAEDMGSLRHNVASIFKNFAIHGQFGVVHQIRASIAAPTVAASRNPQPNVFTPVLGVPFTIKTPVNVYQSGFQTGKYMTKTTEVRPDGATDGAELYQVLENAAGTLSLLPVGTAVSNWEDGQFLEIAQNREIVGLPLGWFDNWAAAAITVATGPFQGTYDQFLGTGAYTSGNNSIVGAMEGLADLFPWYTDPADPETRIGLDRPFRDQPNRLLHSQQQAGAWVVQQQNEHIIDSIMRGIMLSKMTVPYADIIIYMNEYTRQQMGYEEAGNMRVVRDNLISGPIVYQRGVKTLDWQVGNSLLKEVVEDNNLPTDVILIGPKLDMSYNCWNNSTFRIDDFIRETWPTGMPRDIADIEIPRDFSTSLNIDDRVIVGPPTLGDGRLASFTYGNGIRHPKNVINVAYQEMGALFTEYPQTYTVVKLLEPITDLATV